MRFSVCSIEPEGYRYAHFLYDICKYISHGIESAGYECCMVRNLLYSDRINIIIGGHNLTDPVRAGQIRRSGRYVLLQSEIITGDSINNWAVQKSFSEVYLPLMRQALAVWTGVESNVSQLQQLGINAELLRIGYHPLMEEIRHKHRKDIDFLFCGSVTGHRKKMLEELRARGNKVVTVFDDAAIFRNDLIARARVNLAPNQGNGMNHFGGSRVLYLVNNRAIVVVERCFDQTMFEHCFPSADTEKWADLCMETLVHPDLERTAEEYYERFKKIRMVDFIQPLLDRLAVSDRVCAHLDSPFLTDGQTETAKPVRSENLSQSDSRASEDSNAMVQKIIEKAEALFRRERLPEAVNVYAAGIKKYPHNRGIYLALAERLIDARQFQYAFEILEQMPVGSEDPKSHALKGYCREGLGDDSEAERYAGEALSMEENNASARNLEGVIAYKKGDREKAEKYFNLAIENGSGYGEPYTNLGVMKWSAGERQAGLDLLEQGFVLSPLLQDIPALYHNAASELGLFLRAERVFYDVLRRYPDSQKLTFLLIDLLLKQQKYTEAMGLIEKAIAGFGTDDGTLSAAMAIREKIGAREIGKNKNNPVSLCMIVKNEEKYLAQCLFSVRDIADEMIVVDTGSTDRTKDIATIFGAKVYDFVWNDDFSAARNFSLDHAKGAWIFVLDGDEVISLGDHNAMRQLIRAKQKKPAAYSFVTRNYILDVRAGWVANDGAYTEEVGSGWIPSEKVRLFKRDDKIRFVNPVHELVEPSLYKGGYKIVDSAIPIHHYGKLDTKMATEKQLKYFELGLSKLKQNEDDTKAIFELAVQANELGRYEEAIVLWKRLISIKPGFYKAYMNITKSFGELGRIEEALQASEIAISLCPGDRDALFNYSLTEFYAGDLTKAEKALTTILKKEHDYPMAVGLSSLIAFLSGRRNEGMLLRDRLRRSGFRYSEYLTAQAKKLVQIGRPQAASMLLKEAQAAGEQSSDVSHALAMLNKSSQEE